MIFLTDEERKRFSAYLKQEAESDKGMLEQTDKMYEKMQMAGPLKAALHNKLYTEMIAKLSIASILDRTETM